MDSSYWINSCQCQRGGKISWCRGSCPCALLGRLGPHIAALFSGANNAWSLLPNHSGIRGRWVHWVNINAYQTMQGLVGIHAGRLLFTTNWCESVAFHISQVLSSFFAQVKWEHWRRGKTKCSSALYAEVYSSHYHKYFGQTWDNCESQISRSENKHDKILW